MHAGRRYSLIGLAQWTRRESLIFTLIASVPVALDAMGVVLPSIPWAPIAMLGTAVAFVTGFKSNAAYGRLWEARQIWGGIVNASRTWAVYARDLISIADGDEARATHRKLVYRHLAWITALRHQLRETRLWENTQVRADAEYRKGLFTIPEQGVKLDDALVPFLDASELAEVLPRKNRAVAILDLQSKSLAELMAKGQLTEHTHLELARTISLLFGLQGQAERIKNFPYPRQFATLNLVFVWLFILLLPFGIISEFIRVGDDHQWLTIPVTVTVAWVIHSMDKIGEASANPFEGGPNDTPITAMSRGIEIDLKDLLHEKELPAPMAPVGNILL